MKAKPFQFEALTQQIKTQYAGALVYGTDISYIQEISNKIKQLIIPQSNEFSLVNITSSQIKQTPFIATDEANMPNLMGDRRLIWIKDVNNLSDEVVRNFCDHLKTNSFLLISCENLPKNNALRIEAESNTKMITFACYPPEENELIFLIKDFIKQVGFQITSDAIAYLIQNTSNNLSVLKSELEKINLYNHDKKTITLPVIEKIISGGTVQLDYFIQLVANGQISSALPLISKLIQQGEMPVSILRTLVRYFNLLLSGKSMFHNGNTISLVVDKLLKPAQFRLKQPLQKQLSFWTLPKLVKIHHLLLNTEIKMKTNTLSQELILEKLLLEINPQ